MEVISKDEILDSLNPIEFEDGWKNIPDNIIYFVVYFSDGKSREYKTPWVSDLWCGKDYIQRYIKKDNKYIWTYNTTMISNNYFSHYGLEEKIKSELNLPYDHKIKDEDLVSFKEISLVIEEGSIFKNVEVIIEDLKKFVNLKN